MARSTRCHTDWAHDLLTRRSPFARIDEVTIRQSKARPISFRSVSACGDGLMKSSLANSPRRCFRPSGNLPALIPVRPDGSSAPGDSCHASPDVLEPTPRWLCPPRPLDRRDRFRPAGDRHADRLQRLDLHAELPVDDREQHVEHDEYQCQHDARHLDAHAVRIECVGQWVVCLRPRHGQQDRDQQWLVDHGCLLPTRRFRHPHEPGLRLGSLRSDSRLLRRRPQEHLGRDDQQPLPRLRRGHEPQSIDDPQSLSDVVPSQLGERRVGERHRRRHIQHLRRSVDKLLPRIQHPRLRHRRTWHPGRDLAPVHDSQPGRKPHGGELGERPIPLHPLERHRRLRERRHGGRRQLQPLGPRRQEPRMECRRWRNVEHDHGQLDHRHEHVDLHRRRSGDLRQLRRRHDQPRRGPRSLVAHRLGRGGQLHLQRGDRRRQDHRLDGAYKDRRRDPRAFQRQRLLWRHEYLRRHPPI